MKLLLCLIMISLSFSEKEITQIRNFDRSGYYAAMRLNDLVTVNSQLSKFENETSTEEQAFVGALLMKKASLVKGAFKKLKLFKAGREKLEAALSKDPSNTEFHLLRLMIQENAPGIVEYNDALKQDSDFIKSNFKNSPKELEETIIAYSKASKQLSPADFT